MKCTSCGSELLDNAKFCTTCGTRVVAAPVAEPVKQIPVEPVKPVTPPPAQPVRPVPPVQPVTPPVFPAAPVLPKENKPLSPWAYYGLQLLFAIPLVGFICLIVFSLDNGNINRRNFARSYWCNLLITLAVVIVITVLLLVTGASEEVFSELQYMF